MKAILNLPAANTAYRQHNWHTFEVKQISEDGNQVTLLIDGRWVDFTAKEVLIVDLHEEMRKAHGNNDWYGNAATRSEVTKLTNYAKVTGHHLDSFYFTPAQQSNINRAATNRP